MEDLVISFDLDCADRALIHEDGDNDAEGPRRFHTRVNRPTLSPEGMVFQRSCRKALYAGVQCVYMQQKWGVEAMTELMNPRTKREPFGDESFAGRRRLPLNAWVVDTDRLNRLREWLRDVGRHTLDVGNYDTNVILRAVST